MDNIKKLSIYSLVYVLFSIVLSNIAFAAEGDSTIDINEVAW